MRKRLLTLPLLSGGLLEITKLEINKNKRKYNKKILKTKKQINKKQNNHEEKIPRKRRRINTVTRKQRISITFKHIIPEYFPGIFPIIRHNNNKKKTIKKKQTKKNKQKTNKKQTRKQNFNNITHHTRPKKTQ